MRISRVYTTLCLVGATVAMSVALSGCGILELCGAMDPTVNGTWVLSTVNGAAIPANGYPLPDGSGNRLRASTISVIAYHSGGCAKSEPDGPMSASTYESGNVVVEYQLLNAAGGAQPAKTYAGSFDHPNRTDVTLQSDGRSVGGALGASEVTFTGTLPTLGGLTLVFRR